MSSITPPNSNHYDRDPYGASFSRETFDSTISNHRNSFLASQIAPHWSPDTLPACEACSKDFSVRRRRHHCRKCGLLICYKCSKNKLVVPRYGSTPERVCDSCFNTVMYNPNTALLGDFEEEDLKAKLYEATIRVAVAATEAAKIQSTIQGISVGVTGSVLGKEVDALGMNVHVHNMEEEEYSTGALLASSPTLLYARNKAFTAFSEYEKIKGSNPHFSIAFECGLDSLVDGTHDFFTWVVIYNGKEFGSSRSQSFCLPPSIMSHLQNNGMQKRDAERIIFGSLASLPLTMSVQTPGSSPKSPSRSSIISDQSRTVGNPATPKGAIAHLLHGKMTWSRYLEQSVVLAFLPFQWHDLFSVIEL